MGDRYHLTVTCPHCDTVNDGVYFAPTCEIGSDHCKTCSKKFWIGDDYLAHKEPVDIDMRKHSIWGDQFKEKTGSEPIQKLD